MNIDTLQRKVRRFTNPRRVEKDRIECRLTNSAFGNSYGGAVLTLTGPAVERHVDIYSKFFPLIVVAENDRPLANLLRGKIKGLRRVSPSDIILFSGNVFDYEHPSYLPKLSLLDLDFTQGHTPVLEKKIVDFSNNHPNAWLRVTYNARSPYSLDLISQGREKTHEIAYRAVMRGHGDPMVTTQFKPV